MLEEGYNGLVEDMVDFYKQWYNIYQAYEAISLIEMFMDIEVGYNYVKLYQAQKVGMIAEYKEQAGLFESIHSASL